MDMAGILRLRVSVLLDGVMQGARGAGRGWRAGLSLRPAWSFPFDEDLGKVMIEISEAGRVLPARSTYDIRGVLAQEHHLTD